MGQNRCRKRTFPGISNGIVSPSMGATVLAMRIAQIAPLFEPVPPRGYGGSERVVSWLTEELVALGHEVTLFATGDSDTAARLIPVRALAERFQRNFEKNNAPYARMLELVRRQAAE